MKKNLIILASLFCASAAFVACDDENESGSKTHDITVTEGVFVVNSGNSYNGIAGSLTTYSPYTGANSTDAFAAVNGRSLGATPNDGIAYGSKIYLVVDGENRIEVLDAATLKATTPISTIALLGETEGVSPRHILALDGRLYVSTFGGVVAAIDTTDYSLAAKYKVGAYPEGMAVSEGKLWVANSSYGDGQQPSLSIIDLSSGAVETLEDEAIKNPSTLLAVGGSVYVMEGDLYDWQTWAVVSAGGLRKVTGRTVERVVDGGMAMGANQMAAKDDVIYMIKDAYTAPVCLTYNTRSGAVSEMPLEGLVAANAINVDQTTGEIYVLSYSQSAEVSEYTQADYNAPGFANRYDALGHLVATFPIGVGPTAIFFRQGVVQVAYE